MWHSANKTLYTMCYSHHFLSASLYQHIYTDMHAEYLLLLFLLWYHTFLIGQSMCALNTEGYELKLQLIMTIYWKGSHFFLLCNGVDMTPGPPCRLCAWLRKKTYTPVIPLPSYFILYCSKRNRCGEIMELLWLLWGWTKQNGAGRSQHFSNILCPGANEIEHHRRLYIVSIIFYDSNTFRSTYWGIQQWEDYVVPHCYWLNNSESCSNQFRMLLTSAFPKLETPCTFQSVSHNISDLPVLCC